MTIYYSQTPNTMVPLNSRKPGEIAEIAKQQLKPYQELARDWGIWTDRSHPQIPKRCLKCQQCIWFERDTSGDPYLYENDEVIALTVAHIRQVHKEVLYHDERAG